MQGFHHGWSFSLIMAQYKTDYLSGRSVWKRVVFTLSHAWTKNENRSRARVCLSRSRPVMPLIRFQFILSLLLDKGNIVWIHQESQSLMISQYSGSNHLQKTYRLTSTQPVKGCVRTISYSIRKPWIIIEHCNSQNRTSQHIITLFQIWELSEWGHCPNM